MMYDTPCEEKSSKTMSESGETVRQYDSNVGRVSYAGLGTIIRAFFVVVIVMTRAWKNDTPSVP